MRAAIDVGSNTVRMLVGRCCASEIQPELYRQTITRLAGGYLSGRGLALGGIERTLAAITDFANILQQLQVEQVRVVGTAALRRAENSKLLVSQVKLKTRLELEIISGSEEAGLSSSGVQSVLDPCPETALIIDIGGGSCEIIFTDQGQIRFSRSYPLGVVQLCEEMPETEHRLQFLADMVVKFSTDLLHAGITPIQLKACELVGTAGTMTSLAAIDLQMSSYDPARINNHLLDFRWLENTLHRLNPMSVAEREELPGLEPGRGDLIVPGLELVVTLCRFLQKPAIRVVNAGLLEGILLNFCRH